MTGTAAAEFTCGRRAWGAAWLGGRGRCRRLRVRAREGPGQRREVRRTQAAVVCDVEPKRRGTGRDPRRRRKEVAESAVRCVDAGAAAGRVRLEVRGGMGPGGVEAGVRPRGGAREPEL